MFFFIFMFVCTPSPHTPHVVKNRLSYMKPWSLSRVFFKRYLMGMWRLLVEALKHVRSTITICSLSFSMLSFHLSVYLSVADPSLCLSAQIWRLSSIQAWSGSTWPRPSSHLTSASWHSTLLRLDSYLIHSRLLRRSLSWQPPRFVCHPENRRKWDFSSCLALHREIFNTEEITTYKIFTLFLSLSFSCTVYYISFYVYCKMSRWHISPVLFLSALSLTSLCYKGQLSRYKGKLQCLFFLLFFFFD